MGKYSHWLTYAFKSFLSSIDHFNPRNMCMFSFYFRKWIYCKVWGYFITKYCIFTIPWSWKHSFHFPAIYIAFHFEKEKVPEHVSLKIYVFKRWVGMRNRHGWTEMSSLCYFTLQKFTKGKSKPSDARGRGLYTGHPHGTCCLPGTLTRHWIRNTG